MYHFDHIMHDRKDISIVQSQQHLEAGKLHIYSTIAAAFRGREACTLDFEIVRWTQLEATPQGTIGV